MPNNYYPDQLHTVRTFWQRGSSIHTFNASLVNALYLVLGRKLCQHINYNSDDLGSTLCYRTRRHIERDREILPNFSAVVKLTGSGNLEHLAQRQQHPQQQHCTSGKLIPDDNCLMRIPAMSAVCVREIEQNT